MVVDKQGDAADMQVVEREVEAVDVTADGSEDNKVTLPPDHAPRRRQRPRADALHPSGGRRVR